MSNTKNILFVGVGGQGTILASKVLTEGLLNFGYDVKMSEVHGMAQRGGSVTTQVRYGECVSSPLIEKGTVDVIVSFEKSEAARWVSYLKDEGTLIVNDYEIYPITVLIGMESYPEDVSSRLKALVKNTVIVDAHGMAGDLGNVKSQNIILLGALIKALNLEDIDWEKVLENNVPKKALELNKKAFKIGLEF
ncbi:indolepyruvate oxidoreductase subunit beta [Clostridium algidicarnis]|uniref:Indolepyruvate ferredoxin oxidoreductase beta subunit n=2 Tax=Clostridium algidicarnis TaxID=37659 RepID=A0A2S6G1F0_9CLOT|nr:indolepyruvate oxidoreductase subunit beta [Clostridium algidicarnis]MBB6631215.1 indolepyruvate oxidoreductase subunit beta [Clostridium algidicarnis]MBB6696133.1 indolepyruvate oxidoreductase subunit beta [Clostridium algidicarnis]MBU3193873.1 indolepyruvate oxidoreductase subunit beta [Clostridium algidicarnis]MBU3219897.1 indolepyruvate oxidoreductase subunit beta [Clostridium algidicarnis]MCB2285636.1 indolepyruvate oxidoreductase subunit beta [Clostridium algidicarnis]